MLLYQILWLYSSERGTLTALAANVLLVLVPQIVAFAIVFIMTTLVNLLLLIEGMGHEVVLHFDCLVIIIGEPRWRIWLRHCATSRKVSDSIPKGVTGIFL